MSLLRGAPKRDRMKLNLKNWVFACPLELFHVISTILKNSKEGEGFFPHLLEIGFALSSYGCWSRSDSSSHWVHGLIIFPILSHKDED